MSQKPTSIALFVNPDPHMAWSMQQTLLPDGWQAIAAHTGTSAMAQAATARIRVAFVSSHLPDMDSRDLMQHLRKLRADTSVIIISDCHIAGDADAQEALHYAALFNLIAKPFDLAEISALAQRPMERQYAA